MKNHILPAIKLTVVLFVLTVMIYPAAVWGIARLAGPNQGEGDLENVGQSFANDRYFYSRPSAVAYNGAGSGGSNKGPSNPGYLTDVQARIDTILKHNPGITKEEIPADLVTTSGSGLDPHISPKAAKIQVKRIAAIRNLSETELMALVQQHVQPPLLGLFGTERVHVLKLNKALDNLSNK